MANDYTPPEFTPAPPPGYWYLHLNSADQAKASKAARTRVAHEFADQVQKGVEVLTRQETDTEKIVEGLRKKPVQLWVGQRVYFPRMFEKRWAQWERLDDTPEGRRLRDAIIGQIQEEADALERQLLLQEAQQRVAPPVMATAPAATQGAPGGNPNEPAPSTPAPVAPVAQAPNA
jgi:hypothetical protein